MSTLRSSDNREPTYLSEPGLQGVSSPSSLIGAESDQLSALLWQGVLVLALVAVLTQSSLREGHLSYNAGRILRR